ncbi:hypothetical protein D3C80_2108700 [compost metagenome]
MRALGGHDPGNARHREDIALGVATGADQGQGLWLHPHPGFGDRFATGVGLVADIDHVRVAMAVQVGQGAG